MPFPVIQVSLPIRLVNEILDAIASVFASPSLGPAEVSTFFGIVYVCEPPVRV